MTERLIQHITGWYPGFTKKYKCKYLVYHELYDSIELAIAREKQLKRWHRSWKINLIRKSNPTMKDLSDEFIDEVTMRLLFVR